jgi:hypothetical protein
MAAPNVGETIKVCYTDISNGFKYIFHVIVTVRREKTELTGSVQHIFAAGPDEGELMCGNDICRRFKGQQHMFKTSDIIP